MLDKEEEKKKVPTITISSIKFNNGEEEPLDPDSIVVFVGGNNVGKSRALKDVKNILLQSDNEKVVIKEVKVNEENFEIDSITTFFEDNYGTSKDKHDYYHVMIEQNQYSYNFKNNSYAHGLEDFYKCFYSFLSTENRLSMTSSIPQPSQNAEFLNMWIQLDTDELSLIKTNNLLLSIFDKAIDTYSDDSIYQSYKCYKIGTKQQIDETIGTNPRYSKKKLPLLENLHDQGDGIRSAIAVFSTLILGNKSIVLIDEPETFLHPPQAKAMGTSIVELSKNKQCFIATHNIDLIRGMLESESDRIKIVKIDRYDDKNEFNILTAEDVSYLSKDKNLKYTNILNGLFYKNVVLCENESDCKYFSAILENVDNKEFQQTLFCGVGGKSQFKKIIPLLKKTNINFKVIADLDLIDSKTEIKSIINAINENEYDSISERHSKFLKLYQKEHNLSFKSKGKIKGEINTILKNGNEDEILPNETVDKLKDVLKNLSCFELLKSGKGSVPSGECSEIYDSIIRFLKASNIYVLECGVIEKLVKEFDFHGELWVNAVFTKYPDLSHDIYCESKKLIKEIFNLS